MTAVTAEPRATSWDDLDARYHAAETDAERGEVLREAKRREHLEAQRKARGAERAEWEDAARAQYLLAERVCRGNLVRRDSPVRDGWALWSGPAAQATANASEELRNFWDEHPRITVTRYREQISDGKRIQRDQHDAQATQEPTEGETMIGGIAGHIAGRAVRDTIRTAERTASGLDRQQRYAAAQEYARQAVSQRAAEMRTGLAVRAPAGLVRKAEPVDGAETLSYIFTFLKRFAIWGSDAEIVTATLWVAMTYARDGGGMPVWQYCARLGIFGPSGSGKSWKSRLIGKLASNGEILVEPTKPAFIDLCAEQHTVILTEADEAFRSPGRSRGIVAVINASYEPDRSSSRKQGGVAVKIPLFVHAVLDGIDDVMLSETRPDLRAMISRCIIILARPAPEGYRPPRFDRQARAVAEMIGQRCAQWMAQEVADDMADDVPQVPEHLGNRPFALWEPLMTVALRADKGDPEGPWSVAARDACEQLEAAFGAQEQDDETKSELDRVMGEWSEA